jgi:hypothetical protein
LIVRGEIGAGRIRINGAVGDPPPTNERFKLDSEKTDSKVRVTANVMPNEDMSNKPQPEPHSRIPRELAIA